MNCEGQLSQYVREPGSVAVSEKIRGLLLDKENSMVPTTELFLFEAARSEFFYQVVIPKLKSGTNVVADRSGLSTIAYQGYAGGVDIETINQMNKIATFGYNPDLAIIIDVPVKRGLEKEVSPDRFAAKGESFHEKVNEGYREIAKAYKKIVVVPYVHGEFDEMQGQIRKQAKKLIGF